MTPGKAGGLLGERLVPRQSRGFTSRNYLALAGLPKRTTPIAAERAVAREEALQRQREAQIAELRAARARPSANHAAAGQPEPKWGTKEAKRREIERVRREIEERKKP